MYKIGNMRQKGNPVIFRTEMYSQLVVIKEFTPDHRTNFFIPFSITLERVVQITKQTPKEAVDKAAEVIKAETNAWDKIYQANQDSLQSPHKIQIGQELKLP